MGSAVRYALWQDGIGWLIEGVVKELVQQTEAGYAVKYGKICKTNFVFKGLYGYVV